MAANMTHFRGHYAPWQMRRLVAILEHVPPESFAGKNVIELGCGNAFFGEHFARLGANVVCVDGRKEHLDRVNARASLPQGSPVLTRLKDLDGDFAELGVYDYVLDLGLLYHSSNRSDTLPVSRN
jgi:2-polyprenyl-3-methyl-5-hydroxy-6-metoxy-1,4-benzoquinol methylase